MTVGDELKVENRDPLLHNTHPVYLGDKSLKVYQDEKASKAVKPAELLADPGVRAAYLGA